MNSFLGFALNSILRKFSKNLFIYIILSILITINLSFFTVSNSIQKELETTLSPLPDIIVQKIEAGRQRNIEISRADKILNIQGVENVFTRLWGYYYFDFAGANFSVIGIDIFDSSYKKSLNDVADLFNDTLEENSIIVGKAVYDLFQKSGYKQNVYFKDVNGSYLKLKIAGVFDKFTDLESADTIIMNTDLFRKIFGIPENMCTDIAVKIANPIEIPNIKNKISLLFSDIRIITKKDIETSYQNIFDYKKSIFTLIIAISLFTFFIIIFDKLSGVDTGEKHEVALLKSLGWSISDILRTKFYEAFIISFLSYLTGFLISIIFVYYLNAPFLKDIFTGYSILKPEFNLNYYFDFSLYFTVFLLSIPVYIAATIIPSWKIATLDADEVIK